MKLIRLTLSFFFMCIFYSSTTFAVEITTDEDLQTDTQSLAYSLAVSHYHATNCEDDGALSRISFLKRRTLEFFADKGFSKSAINQISDYMDNEIKEERELRGVVGECNRDALNSIMALLEMDYKHLDEELHRYIMP